MFVTEFQSVKINKKIKILKDTLIIQSNWAEEIQQSLVKTNAFCIALFSIDGKLLFSNEAFQLLTKNEPVESFVNPRFSDLCQLTKEINPIFSGVLTLGDYYSINTSIEAKVYYKHDQLLITGGVDVSQLLEYNMMMHRLNRDNANMQRELIKKTRTIEQFVNSLKETNEELEKVNREYASINEELLSSNKEIIHLNTQLSDKNQQLKELNATKDKFFSFIAHDLRNPFNSLLGFTDLLKRNASSYSADEITDFANEMAESAKFAYQLVENLLDWSRVQRGIIRPQPEWFEAGEIASELTQLTYRQASAKKINISTETSPDTLIFADREMIRLVLRNLVSNAIKFTHEQGSVSLKIYSDKQQVHFSVIDNGIGIESDKIAQLFQIDNKTAKSGTNGEQGTGLGLILCKEFVELHEGKIWATSSPNVGSEFHFTIPVKQPK